MVVCILPRYTSIPSQGADCYVYFCWSELLLYFRFCNLPNDIGRSNEEIITHWQQIKHTYRAWHVHRSPEEPPFVESNDVGILEMKNHHSMDMDEWKFLSQLHPSNDILLDNLDMLGHHNFDANHNWVYSLIASNLQEIAIFFVVFNHSSI